MNRFAQRSRTGISSNGSRTGDGRTGPRFMGRRRLDRTDRNGDPLDGVVNLFDVAIVLAVAFLLAALSGIGLSDLLAGEDMTLVKNPGQADMELIIREGDTLQRLQHPAHFGKHQMVVGKPMPTVPEMRAAWDAIRPNQEAVMAGKMAPKDAAKAMQDACEKLIREMTK